MSGLKMEKEEHEAYGMLKFSRVQGGDPSLFGSSVKHSNKIVMTLCHGSVARELSNDWFFAESPVCEVEMSMTQFSEAITSMNMGSGVPVTIRYTEKDGYMKPITFTNKRTQFVEEFRADNLANSKKAIDILSEVRELFERKGTIKTGEKKEIIRKLNQLTTELTANSDFAIRQFDEATEKIVTAAKGEVEAFVANKMQSIALAAIAEGGAGAIGDGKSIISLSD